SGSSRSRPRSPGSRPSGPTARTRKSWPRTSRTRSARKPPRRRPRRAPRSGGNGRGRSARRWVSTSTSSSGSTATTRSLPRRPLRKPPGPRVSERDDARWLAAAACLGERARPLSRPNPAVGALVVRDGIVIGRGWTQRAGRPHAEAVALAQAGEAARGATLYVTLEPCAHRSQRGPACADLVVEAGIARAVIGVADPDPRTAGHGVERLRTQGIAARVADDEICRAGLAGYLARRTLGRPFVTLKLAVTADGF